MPARWSAALMANPPSSAALNEASAPESLPIGVRAPARMTEPAMRWAPPKRPAVRQQSVRSPVPIQPEEPRGRRPSPCVDRYRNPTGIYARTGVPGDRGARRPARGGTVRLRAEPAGSDRGDLALQL